MIYSNQLDMWVYVCENGEIWMFHKHGSQIIKMLKNMEILNEIISHVYIYSKYDNQGFH